MIKSLLVTLLTISSFETFGFCLPQWEGDVNLCIVSKDASANKACQDSFGDDFLEYSPTDTCSPDIAEGYNQASDAGERNQVSFVQAACLSFESSIALGCSYWDYTPADKYCALEYGANYAPHKITDTCSIEKAEELAGYVSVDSLTVGLEKKIKKAEDLLGLIDRMKISQALPETVSKKIIVSSYNDENLEIVKELMLDIKGELYKRSAYKVRFDAESKAIDQLNFLELMKKRNASSAHVFLSYIFRYIGMTERLGAIYVQIAHKDKVVNFDFEELDQFRLILKKQWGLEAIAKVNIKGLTINDGKDLKFLMSEQDKLLLEYTALSEPQNEEDFAKLLVFTGARENFVNIWAVDRLTPNNLLDSKINSCGDFLSFQSAGTKIRDFNIIKELRSDDVFYNDYLQRLPQIIEAVRDISLIDGKGSEKILKMVYLEHDGFKKLIELIYKNDVTESQLLDHFEEDQIKLKAGEDYNWDLFSRGQFRSIMMFGDDTLNPRRVIKIISDQIYAVRTESIINEFLGNYSWMRDSQIETVKQSLSHKIEKNLKKSFMKRIRSKLKPVFEGYNNPVLLAEKNRTAKIKSTFKNANKVIVEAKTLFLLDGLDHPLHLIAPATIGELALLIQDKISRDYQDLDLTIKKSKKMSSLYITFLNEISKKFNKKYLRLDNSTGKEKHLESNEERSKALREIFLEVAYSYYTEGKFKLASLATLPNAVNLSRDRDKMIKNPYTIQIFEDGTPVVLTIKDFYKTFEKGLNIEIFTGYQTLKDVILSGKTNGDFGFSENYISKKGEVRFSNSYQDNSAHALQKLYHDSLRTTMSEINADKLFRKKIQKEVEEKKSKSWYDRSWDFAFGTDEENEQERLIKDPKDFFARIFEVYNISIAHVGRREFGGEFISKVEDEVFLATSRVKPAYDAEPILRVEVKKFRRGDDTEPLLLNIARRSFVNKKTSQIYNTTKAKAQIEKVLVDAETNISGKLNAFCKADTKNYKTDPHFKKIFRSSAFLRKTLKSEIGTTKVNSLKIQKFDSSVKEKVRSGLEAANDDYIEPALLTLGAVAITAIGIVLLVGSMGTAAPAILTSSMGMLSLFLSIEFYASFPLAASFLVHRLNSQFIEIPENLKFQESLAKSQIDSSKIIDWDLLNEAKAANKLSKIITIGTLPLDLFYGYAVISHARKSLGYTGKAAYKRLTGVQLTRGFSKPPVAMRVTQSYKKLRKKHGRYGAIRLAVKNSWINLARRSPKYQGLSKEMMTTTALRSGVGRVLTKIDKKIIISEITKHLEKLKSRVVVFDKIANLDGTFTQRLSLNGGLRAGEALEFGLGKIRIFYMPKSYLVAMKDNKLMMNYISKYGEILSDLKLLQGEFIHGKIKGLEGLLDKLKSSRNADDMLRIMSNDEILLLKDVARYTDGEFKVLKKIFKDYKLVVEGLRPMTYAYGPLAGQEFKNQAYPKSPLMAQRMAMPRYVYKDSGEDLKRFYESVVRQDAKLGESGQRLKAEIEDKLSQIK